MNQTTSEPVAAPVSDGDSMSDPGQSNGAVQAASTPSADVLSSLQMPTQPASARLPEAGSEASLMDASLQTEAAAAKPLPAAALTDLNRPELYLNRELTWLAFNWRVLAEAADRRNPLLERLKFLSITASNLDEFFMKRIGGLKQQVVAGMRSEERRVGKECRARRERYR